MGKTSKKRKVTLGASALSFYDASTGIQVCPRQVVELSPKQLLSKKIQKALHNGHLQFAIDAEEPVDTAIDAKELADKLQKMLEKGMTTQKVAKAFTMAEATALAATKEIKPDEGDSVETVLKAYIEEQGWSN